MLCVCLPCWIRCACSDDSPLFSSSLPQRETQALVLEQAELRIQELEERLQGSASRDAEAAGGASSLLEGDLLRLHDDNIALQSAVATFSAALANEAADGASSALETEVREEEVAMYKRQIADLTRHLDKMRSLSVRVLHGRWHALYIPCCCRVSQGTACVCFFTFVDDSRG